MAGYPDTSQDLTRFEAPVWHVEMFGVYRVKAANSPLDGTDSAGRPGAIERFQTQKTALLFALLVSRSAALSRDVLTLRLWPDADLSVGRDRSSQTLSWLRRHLEAKAGFPPKSIIQADHRNVWLTPGAVATDVSQFDALLSQARKANASNDVVMTAHCLEAATMMSP